MWLKDYGVAVFRNGIILHGDGRWRRNGTEGTYIVPHWYRKTAFQGEVVNGLYVVPRVGRDNGFRSPISGLSPASARRLEFVAANVSVALRMHVTLTYRARAEGTEDEAKRNRRIAERSKADLNRFLDCVREELLAYLWVQEFQKRGVVHYHVLAERLVEEDRLRVAWLRAIEALDDPAAIKHGVKVDAIDADEDVRKYLGRYMGKVRQKRLPPGVERAGRWWGRSRSLRLAVVREVVGCQRGAAVWERRGARVVRCLRKFIGRKLGWRYRGGMILDWGGELSAAATRAVEQLEEFYPEESGDLTPEKMALLERFGWELLKGGLEDGQGSDDGFDLEAGSVRTDRATQCWLEVT